MPSRRDLHSCYGLVLLICAGVAIAGAIALLAGCAREGKEEKADKSEEPTAEEKDAVAAIERVGGRVEVLSEIRKKDPPVEVRLIDCAEADAALKHIGKLRQAHIILLGGSGVTDHGLKELRNARDLKALSLGDTRI